MSNARTQSKQAEILTAARQLFLENGYDAVTLDDILERVGGSKSTLYCYYGGKEGLFAATVQQACKDRLESLLSMDVSHVDPAPGLTAIGMQFLVILSDAEGRDLFRTMISEAQRFPHLASEFYASGPGAIIRALRRSLEHWQKNGLLKPGNPEVLATQFLGLLMGNFHVKTLLGVMGPLTEKQKKAWVAQSVELFLNGARTTHG